LFWPPAHADQLSGLLFMKRKIAAIFAADIAGYSRLVEDEEETLRRLASYRQVTDDFIARSGGRILQHLCQARQQLSGCCGWPVFGRA
jgi:class 3 adenylate cyclase